MKAFMARPVDLPTYSNTILSHPSEAKKSKGDNMVDNSFNTGAREESHAIIARMYYSSGLPFNLARNPYYNMAFTYVANNLISVISLLDTTR